MGEFLVLVDFGRQVEMSKFGEVSLVKTTLMSISKEKLLEGWHNSSPQRASNLI